MLDWLWALAEILQNMGFWGLVLYWLGTVLTGLLLMPTAGWELMGGAIYGVPTAFLLITAAVWVILPVTLLLGRGIFRPWVDRLLARNLKARRTFAAIEEHGLILMALIRLSPLTPFGITNALLAVSHLPIWKITLASYLGMAPVSLFFIWAGAQAKSLTEASQIQTPMWMWVIGTLALVGVTTWITVKVGRVLNAVKLEEESENQARAL
jgi:uncharacterized membrane protein YdjX (TVP38/TMEM64 family)